jgi:hypothetical protein
MDVSHWLLLDMSVNGARRREACNLSSSHLASQSKISEATLPERQTAGQPVSQFRRGPAPQTQRVLKVKHETGCAVGNYVGKDERDLERERDPTPFRKEKHHVHVTDLNLRNTPHPPLP